MLDRTVFSPPDMDPSRPGVQEPGAGSLVQVGLSPGRSSLEFFNADCGAILVWTRDAVLR